MTVIANGQKIKSEREKRRWEIADLAIAADLSDKSIYRAEQSTRLPFVPARMEIETLKAIAAALEISVDQIILDMPFLPPPEPPPHPERDRYWDDAQKRGLHPCEIETALIDVTVAAGLVVQRYRSGAGAAADRSDGLLDEILLRYSKNGKNPPDRADFEATLAAMRIALIRLKPIADRIGRTFSVLAEESVAPLYREWLTQRLPEVGAFLREPIDFFKPGSMGFGLDGLDGTWNYRNGLWPYCCGGVVFAGPEPLVTAIYDPASEVVYSGALAGSPGGPWVDTARLWDKHGGRTTDLVELWKSAPDRALCEETVNYHLTRSNPAKLEDFLDRLPALTAVCGSTQSWNCGLMAMAMVAGRRLGGSVNNFTNVWDVAPGEVLVRACGGVVSQFNGEPVRYGSLERVSMIAAPPRAWEELQKVLG